MTSDRKVADDGRTANGAVSADQAATGRGGTTAEPASQQAAAAGAAGSPAAPGDHVAGGPERAEAASPPPAGDSSPAERELWQQEQQAEAAIREVSADATRRARLWAAAESKGVPLRAILTTIAAVVLVYLAGKVIFRLREVILLLVVAGFIALLLNPLVLIVQRWLRRRGFAITVVTLFAVLVFAGLAFAFGYPLVNGITHLANNLPDYIRKAEAGQGWIGHLVTKYHVQNWVQENAPKIASYGRNLADPALTLGKGAITLMLALLTIFVLVVLLLLEGPKIRGGLLGMMTADRAARYSRVAAEVNRSVTGYMLGNFATSVIAGAVVFVTLLTLGVPFPFLWALWVALVDFLPMIGGALAGIPTVLFAAAHSLTAGIVTLVVFLIYTQVENHILNPVIMSKTVRINPLLVLVAILAAASLGAWLGGFFGGFVAALLAIPLAGAGQVIVREVWLASAPGSAHRIGEDRGERR